MGEIRSGSHGLTSLLYLYGKKQTLPVEMNPERDEVSLEITCLKEINPMNNIEGIGTAQVLKEAGFEPVQAEVLRK